MSNIDIALKIEGLDGIAGAIHVLASAIGMKNSEDNAPTPVAAAPVMTEQVLKEMPIAPTPAPQVVQTAEPVYTLEQLGSAAAPLMETPQGMEQLQALLAQFNVPSLAQLDKSAYGAFATSIRALGAKI